MGIRLRPRLLVARLAARDTERDVPVLDGNRRKNVEKEGGVEEGGVRDGKTGEEAEVGEETVISAFDNCFDKALFLIGGDSFCSLTTSDGLRDCLNGFRFTARGDKA